MQTNLQFPDYNYALHVIVGKAITFDEITGYVQRSAQGSYAAIVRDKDFREFKTRITSGKPAIWDQYFAVGFENFPGGKHVEVDVIQLDCRSDPGTSTGNRLVGRARFPAPKQMEGWSQGWELLMGQVGTEVKTVGLVSIGMRLTAIQRA